jgi:hypothetical protein
MRRKAILIGYGLILLWMILPMISVLTASAIADASGCTLNEGSSHSCIVLGTDVGETLYTMFVMGWMFFFTVPTGLVALVVFTVIVLVKRRRSTA